jgi:hypothetical protein
MSADKPQFNAGYKRSVATIIMLGLAFLNSIGGILLNTMRYLSFSRLESGEPLSESQRLLVDGLFGLNEIAQILLTLTCAIPFCMWFYQAYKNLLALGNASLTYSPGWAAGSFFVPILNLFRPPKIAKEIWQGSDPAGLDRDRINFTYDQSTPIISFWWISFLLARILDNIGGNIFKEDDITRIKNSTVFFGLSDIALACAAVFAILLVLEVRKRQEDRYQRFQALSAQYAEQPPAGYTGIAESDL